MSPGLVQHHFKTKADLQAAVEIYVFERIGQLGVAGLTEESRSGKLLIGRQIVDFIRENPEIVRYARRVILEDDALGRRLFDQIVGAGRTLLKRLSRQGLLRPGVDMTWANLNTILMVIGPVLLEPGINRHLDRPFRSDEGLLRWDLAVDQMLYRGIYRSQRSRTGSQSSAESPRASSRSKRSGKDAR